MNIYIAIAGVIVAWCAIRLFVRWWQARHIKPFDGFYQGCHQSLLAEVEKEQAS